MLLAAMDVFLIVTDRFVAIPALDAFLSVAVRFVLILLAALPCFLTGVGCGDLVRLRGRVLDREKLDIVSLLTRAELGRVTFLAALFKTEFFAFLFRAELGRVTFPPPFDTEFFGMETLGACLVFRLFASLPENNEFERTTLFEVFAFSATLCAFLRLCRLSGVLAPANCTGLTGLNCSPDGDDTGSRSTLNAILSAASISELLS
mmetsp:Transcript_43927/g.72596  ORF Transcript_43927/g.72596 Transcript_43927/m.72596 type:complete len:205 (-) Transcript_43927:24-638(-)